MPSIPSGALGADCGLSVGWSPVLALPLQAKRDSANEGAVVEVEGAHD